VSERPFYVVADTCNTSASLLHALEQGANAARCDVSYDATAGFVVGRAGADGGMPLDDYLAAAKDVVARYAGMALLIVECGMNQPQQGSELRTRIRDKLTSNSQLNVLFSVATPVQARLFDAIGRDLGTREAIGTSHEHSPSAVSARLATVSNRCFGDGSATPDEVASVRAASELALFGRPVFGHKLVYVAASGDRDALRDYLRIGVDAICVADPRGLLALLAEPEFRASVRLAPRAEPAFQSAQMPCYEITIRTGSTPYAGTDANVFIALDGDLGTTGELALNGCAGSGSFEFERGTEDRFIRTAPNVGNITAVRLRHDNSGWASDWYVDWVQVRRGTQSWLAPCRAWLSRDDPGGLTRTLAVVASPTGAAKWFLPFSPPDVDTPGVSGRPWGDGTKMASRASPSVPEQSWPKPWDSSCEVTTFANSFDALSALRDTLLDVIKQAGVEPGKRGHVYIAGWRFNCQRDLSVDNPWGLQPWRPGTAATRDETAMGLVLKLIRAGVAVHLLLWLPKTLMQPAISGDFGSHVLDHFAAAEAVARAGYSPLATEPPGVVALDLRTADTNPLFSTASHHQKMVVIRSGSHHEAFVGGVDLAFTRRDAPGNGGRGGDWQSGSELTKLVGPSNPVGWHWPHEEGFDDRTLPPPFDTPQKSDLPLNVYLDSPQRWHDQHMKLQGPVVETLEWQFKERWEDSGDCFDLQKPGNWRIGQVIFSSGTAFHENTVTALPEPAAVNPVGSSDVQMWRTIPPRRTRTKPPFIRGEFTVLAGIAHAVKAAEQLIWIFDQYLWSRAFARLVNAQLKARPNLYVIVVLPPHADQATDSKMGQTVHEARRRALSDLADCVSDRVAAFNMWEVSPANRGIYVHAKSHMYDGSLLVCGSANLNRRSLLCDTELACAVHDPAVVRAHQNKLWSMLFGQAVPVPAVDLTKPGAGKEFFERFGHAADTGPSLLIRDSWTDTVVLPNGVRRIHASGADTWLYEKVADPSSLSSAFEEQAGRPVTLAELARRLEDTYDASGRFPGRGSS